MKPDHPVAALLNVLALLGWVFGVPIAVASTIGRPLPGTVFAEGSVWSVLGEPGLVSLMLLMLVVLLTTVWAVLVVSILKEIVCQLRGVPTPDIPGFHLPQMAARHVVGTASLLIRTTPTGADTGEGSRRTPTKGRRGGALLRLGKRRVGVEPTVAGSVASIESSGIRYRVLPGDSLWSIAYTELGLGSRWDEIARLNRTLLGHRPGFLTPGLDLRLPPVALASAPRYLVEEEQPPACEARYHIHSVRAGETLSSIADNWLGDPRRYPEILHASWDIVQPGGRRLLDSATLRVGWKVAIPREDALQDMPIDATEGTTCSKEAPSVAAPADLCDGMDGREERLRQWPSPSVPGAARKNADK